MYLLICSNYQLARFDVMFKNARCNYQALNLFDIEFAEDVIDTVKQNISSYQQIIVSSELLAHKLIEVFKQHSSLEYIAVGTGSARYLVANGVQNVVYPINGSGMRAVLDSGLIKHGSQVMYLTCYKNSYLDILGTAQCLDIYSLYRHKSILQNGDRIKNIILNQDLKGIIITSKKFVAEFFNQCAKFGVSDRLINQSYLVIHESIQEKLVTLGVNKIQLSRDISQIANLLG